jgi:hypothetical protein
LPSELNQPAGIADAIQRAQQQGVHHAEDRGVCTDAERERQDRY